MKIAKLSARVIFMVLECFIYIHKTRSGYQLSDFSLFSSVCNPYESRAYEIPSQSSIVYMVNFSMYKPLNWFLNYKSGLHDFYRVSKTYARGEIS